jgi:virginiamycin B lyase
MRDIDRVVTDSLRSVGYGYRPTDLYGAQAEFHVRRRRRRALRVSGAVALAGAAAVAAVVVAQTQPFADDAPAPATRRMVVAATIDVGEGPSGLTFGDDSLWTANSEDGTVSQIDPETSLVNTHIVGGAPDDVVVAGTLGSELGDVWVANPELGGLQQLDANTGEVADKYVSELWGKGHIDLAAGDFDSVWAVAQATGALIEINTFEGSVAPVRGALSRNWSDVAVGEGGVWLLDERTSSVFRHHPVTAETTEVAVLSQRDIDEDLAAGEGYVWVANGDEGTVVRIDPVTGEVSGKLEVGGDYAAVTTGVGAVWVLAGSNSGIGDLWQIDPDTIQVRGRLTLGGGPADVAVANGSLWVTNQDGDTLTRIDLVEP